MFVSRGARPHRWPSEKCAGLARSLNLHSAGLARICGLLAFVALAGWARADYSYTEYPEDICAIESVYVDGMTPVVKGVTSSGIGYTVTHSHGHNSYIGRYISINSQHATVTIRFEKPMAAIGAQLTVSGYGSFMPDPAVAEGTSLLITENGYRGVVASPGSINEVTFATNNGPISAHRIDFRPLPLAVNDQLQVFQNSSKTYDMGTLLRNDLYADGAVLVQAPQHAEKFHLMDDGSFVYQPAKNFQGVDSFSYRAANGFGASVSDPAVVQINVLPVNCAPDFTMGPNVECDEDGGLQVVPGWAIQATAGTDHEASQNLSWEVSTDRPGLFAQLPGLDLDGTLSFHPAPYQSGVATVTVSLRDDGGVENGGSDASVPRTFMITIHPKSHAPMLEPIMDCAVRAGDALILNVRGTQVDEGTGIVYTLESAPPGATIDTLSGQIIWRPSDAYAGQMPEFVIRATATGPDQLSATTRFRVEVLEVSRPPEILPIDDMQTSPGAKVTTRVAAKQSANMRYFLASDVPGAMLNPLSGQFHWTAGAADAGRTVSFAVTAIDLAKPHLCAMKTFAVHVGATPTALKIKTAPVIMLAKSKSRETAGQAAMRFASIKARKK
jgi:hypothetical protein